jgi:type IV secretory pathway VirB4 component
MTKVYEGSHKWEMFEGVNFLVLQDCAWTGSTNYLAELEYYRAFYNKFFVSSTSSQLHIRIDGRSGIGKSCFLIWLIVKILDQARDDRTMTVGWQGLADPQSMRKFRPKIIYVDREGNVFRISLDQPPRGDSKKTKQ